MKATNLWKEKRWVITALLVSLLAIIAASYTIGNFSYRIIYSLPEGFIYFLAMLFYLFVIGKYLLMSHQNFILLDHRDASNKIWLYDLIFISLMGLILTLSPLGSGIDLWIVPAHLAALYSVSFLWIIFRPLFKKQPQDKAVVNQTQLKMLHFVTSALLIVASIVLGSIEWLILLATFSVVISSGIVEIKLIVSNSELEAESQASESND